MKAFVVARYGKDEVRAADVPEPKVGNRDVLVKVSAASINPLDSMVRNGEFKQLLKYKPPFVLGHDVAGVVTEVGADVRGFRSATRCIARPRDLRIGTFAEYIAIDQDDVALKPASLSLHEAAAVPLVALAAWQILVEKAHVQPGQKVLVHAGAGGLGSTVIQLAKHLGAHVATTASGAKRGNWSATSEPTSSSTTPSRISPRCCRATTSWWTPSAARTSMKSLTVLKPGGLAIGVTGPPDAGFAKQLGAPKPFEFVLSFLSRKVRKAAKKLGVRYSFFFMHASGAQLRELAALYDAGAPASRHRHDLRFRPDPGSDRLRRERQSQGRQGHRHARLTARQSAVVLSPCRRSRMDSPSCARTWRVNSSARTSSAPGLDAIEDLTDHVGGIGFGTVGEVGHVGVHQSYVDTHHLNPSRSELEAHRVRSAPHRRLRHAVTLTHRPPGEHRRDVDDRTGSFGDPIGECGRHGQWSEKVRLEPWRRPEVSGSRTEDTAQNSGVVDENADVRGRVPCRAYRGLIGDIECKCAHARVAVVDRPWVASGGVHLGGAAVEQLTDVLAAHPAIGPGDEHGLADERSHWVSLIEYIGWCVSATCTGPFTSMWLPPPEPRR